MHNNIYIPMSNILHGLHIQTLGRGERWCSVEDFKALWDDRPKNNPLNEPLSHFEPKYQERYPEGYPYKHLKKLFEVDLWSRREHKKIREHREFCRTTCPVCLAKRDNVGKHNES